MIMAATVEAASIRLGGISAGREGGGHGQVDIKFGGTRDAAVCGKGGSAATITIEQSSSPLPKESIPARKNNMKSTRSSSLVQSRDIGARGCRVRCPEMAAPRRSRR